jgi:hypothetical protein
LKCPCKSGRLRRTCNPAPLVPCIGTDDEPCDRLFHMTSNAAKRCEVCRPKRAREMERAKKRRQRQKRRAAIAPPAIDQLALEDAAAA